MTMSATATILPELEPRTTPRRQLPDELKETILEVAESERALDELIDRSARLHRSHIEHDPHSCLVCFGAA
jgi:hypothetical protein